MLCYEFEFKNFSYTNNYYLILLMIYNILKISIQKINLEIIFFNYILKIFDTRRLYFVRIEDLKLTSLFKICITRN